MSDKSDKTELSEIEQMIAQSKKLQNKTENPNSLDKTSPSASDIINNNIVKGVNSHKIAGKDYKIKKLSVREWLKTTPYLGRKLGPCAGLIAEGSVAEAIEYLSMSLDDGEFELLINILLVNVTLGGEKITIDTFEDPMEMLQVVTQVLRLNYESLFTQGIELMAPHLVKAMAAVESLK